MNKNVFVLLSVLSLLILACEDTDKEIVIVESAQVCDSLDVLYTNDVKPILENAGCTGSYCHGGGAAGITISSYETTKTAAQDAKFLKAIKHHTGASPMPKDRDKLGDADIQKIECWIKNGYKE